MRWKSQIGLILVVILTGLLVVGLVQHDDVIYRTPLGRIERVTNLKKVPQTDNFNNHDYRAKQRLQIKILNGKHRGQTVTVKNEYSGSQATDLKYRPGQTVLLHFNGTGQRVKGATILDLKRDVAITILVVIAVGLLILMRRTGIHAIVSVLLNMVLFFIAVEIDVQESGYAVLEIFSVVAVLFSAITLTLVLGWNKKMMVSLLTTLAGTFSAMLIGGLVFSLTGNGELHFETMEYVTQNPEPLFLAETVLGSLGAVMDESTDIIVSLAKLRKENPQISMKQLWISGRNIGKTIMGPLLNVLFMIFMADTFSMMVLYLRNGNSWQYAFEMNMQLGFVQSLISGIGIVLTVPIASWLTGVFFKNKGVPTNG